MGEAALAREFASRPPREQLDSIKALWNDYLWRYVESDRGDPCVPYTAASEYLEQAIRRACDSRGKDGKMFFHQGRVWQANRDAYARNLLDLRNLKKLRRAQDFEDIFEVCDRVGRRTKGIGRVTIYDVTSRIAAWYGYEAIYLHFHAGVEAGLKALLEHDNLPREGRIHRSELPRFFHKKDMDLVESFLCGYRSEIEKVMG
jgi:hypothetical protein